jgi:hypothetical protein
MKPPNVDCRIFIVSGGAFSLTIARASIEILDRQLLECVTKPAIFQTTMAEGMPLRIPGRVITAWQFVECAPPKKTRLEELAELQIEFIKEQFRQLKKDDDWRSGE